MDTIQAMQMRAGCEPDANRLGSPQPHPLAGGPDGEETLTRKARDAMSATGRNTPTAVSGESQPQHRRLLAVYPGSFDPVHLGHIDIARQASSIADEVIVAIYATPNKNLVFSTEERVALCRQSLAAEGLANVRVEPFTALSVDFALQAGA